MLRLRRVDNRHVLWSLLLMVAVGIVVPGGLGIKPPLWFVVKDNKKLAHKSSFEITKKKSQNLAKNLVKPPEISKPIETIVPTPQEDTLEVTEKVPEIASEKALEKVPEIASEKALEKVPEKASEKLTMKKEVSVFTVPSEFARTIPAIHLEAYGNAQKQSFINLVLPLIVASNNELLQRRSAVREAAKTNNRQLLEQWATLYLIDTSDLDDVKLVELLMRRVDTVPVALALAQAAVESGWGTSRFALQGNALFGQWAWRSSAGMRPLDASNKHAVVRSFGTLMESVRAYMHNLNTHQNYRRFRIARLNLKSEPESIKASELALHLDSYAEIGMDYVQKLLAIISSNDLNRYARAEFG